MHINIKATNIELTSEISEYTEKRLRSLDKLIDPEDTTALCDVEIGRTTKHHQRGNIFRAEINVTIKGGQFRAVSEKETLYDAIDTAKDDMMRELRRSKQKHRRLLKKSGVRFKNLMRRFRI